MFPIQQQPSIIVAVAVAVAFEHFKYQADRQTDNFNDNLLPTLLSEFLKRIKKKKIIKILLIFYAQKTYISIRPILMVRPMYLSMYIKLLKLCSLHSYGVAVSFPVSKVENF